MNLFETIIAGLFGAVILVGLQTRAQRKKTSEDFKQAEFREALKVIDSLSASLDKRMQANTRFWERVKSADYNNKDREAFRAAIDDWMSQYSTNFSRIFHYFGDLEQVAFSDFQRKIAHLSRVMIRHLDVGYENLSASDKLEDVSVDGELKLLRKDTREFLMRLNEAATEGRIGQSQFINDLERGDVEEISHVYLFQRLMGWKS